MGNAYMIITDLHDSDKNKANRYDYMQEIFHVKQEIIRIGKQYKQQGHTVVPLFLGDIIDRSYKDVVSGINTNNFMVLLERIFSTPYSVVGNHETSFPKSNPFWAMVAEMDSTKLGRLKGKVCQPRGLINVINVTDELQDGEVCFYFNHHGTGVALPPNPMAVNIGLFHQDILFKGVVDVVREQHPELNIWTANDVYMDNNNLIQDYRYVFFGHKHELYGHWVWTDDITLKKTDVYHLGSLGRPKHDEVYDTFLERNIPVVIVESGKFVSCEDNFITLLDRSSCVKEDVVIKQQNRRSKTEDRKNALDYFPTSEDPLRNIENALKELSDAEYEMYKALCKEGNEYEQEFYNQLKRAGGT